MVSENAEELRNNAPTGEYEYTHIKDDEEFVTYMKQKAIASEALSHLTSRRRALEIYQR